MSNVKNRTVFEGDNLVVLKGMNTGSVDLIYLDPPFNSNRDYSAPIGSKAAGKHFKNTWTLSDVDLAWHGEIANQNQAVYDIIKSARTAHGKGMMSYLIMMAVRLLEMHRVLKDTGSVYLHVDQTASHYLKMLMDAIFGAKNFRNEIVWCYAGGGQSKRNFPQKHDTILRYSKGSSWTFNADAVRVPYDSDYKATVFTAPGTRAPGKTYGPNPNGKLVEDWWTGISRPYGKDRTGYSTQKPLKLLERIIKSSSNPGDVVLDPFCGCATACVAAERLGRQWIGIDVSDKAVVLLRQRLQDDKGLNLDAGRKGQVNHLAQGQGDSQESRPATHRQGQGQEIQPPRQQEGAVWRAAGHVQHMRHALPLPQHGG